ncbi:MAG: hypothetical protein B7Y26_08855 [Hydrogenophilales bacterium 16-64-46]|nr:MAG: hypothetical protein B7Y26_08855 [Hydrogenophilales bacterium 16-64-46]OZA37893.1 MAG: hypothetical protein B7X87_08785 [Hydrogenophilales bacterium 17-64-34]HQT01170.1 hypothetical protein [Thiobacillus sp.]
MKPRWIKFQTVRLSKNRERILELLGNDESVLGDIEGALSCHFALMPQEKEETDTDVRKELDRLAKAISTINEIMQSRGRARSLFLDACGEYIEDGTILRFQQLESALYDEGGNVLVEAARSAAVALDVSSGRDKSPEKNARLHLVGEVARAVEKIGMRTVRGGDFEDLIQLVYESAGIENDRGETIKAEGDIRKWQERQRQPDAG